jgi:hypothetical protein
MQFLVLIAFNRLLNHYRRHFKWIYFTEPVHLQGEINGFVLRPVYKQILHVD